MIADGKHISYFRGRKLHGREVKMPEGYEGENLQYIIEIVLMFDQALCFE